LNTSPIFVINQFKGLVQNDPTVLGANGFPGTNNASDELALNVRRDERVYVVMRERVLGF